MSQEVEFTTNRPGEEKKYQERLDYENMLRYQVMSVGMAINHGYDGYDAAQVLLTMLIPELYEPIAEDVEEARSRLEKHAQAISKYRTVSQIKVIGSNVRAAQDQKYIAQQIREHKRDFSLKIIELVMQVLHEHGMLLSHERLLDEGGY